MSATSESKTKIFPFSAIGLGNGRYQENISLELIRGDGLVDIVVVHKVPPGAILVPIYPRYRDSTTDSVKTAFRLGRKDALENKGDSGARNLRGYSDVCCHCR